MAMETEFGGEGLSYGAWSSEEDVVVFRADRVGVSMGTWGLGCILGINMGAMSDCPALRGVCVFWKAMSHSVASTFWVSTPHTELHFPPHSVLLFQKSTLLSKGG